MHFDIVLITGNGGASSRDDTAQWDNFSATVILKLRLRRLGR